MSSPEKGSGLRRWALSCVLLLGAVSIHALHAMEPEEGGKSREERARERAAPARPEGRRDERQDQRREGRPGDGVARPAAGRPVEAQGPQNPPQRPQVRPSAPAPRPQMDAARPDTVLPRPQFDAGRPGAASPRPQIDAARPAGVPPRPGFAPPPRPSVFNRPPPRERIVTRLPPGYRRYYWSGSPYFQYGGHWYRPYGNSFVIVAAPFGLFLPTLPSYYTSVWVGGSQYYFADDTYYIFDPVRRVYVVSHSPYGDDLVDDFDIGPPVSSPPVPADLFFYPSQGQSEQQQADDRYACHRWAVDQTRYDPTTAEYRAEDRAQYDRAITACMSGRGYSVK
jgi:hypothetical protein